MTKKEKKTKGQTTIYKTLHKKLKIEQHECFVDYCKLRGDNTNNPEKTITGLDHVSNTAGFA